MTFTQFGIYVKMLSLCIEQQSDIEMDIGPPQQKHYTGPKDAEVDEAQAKRQKLCDESSSVKDDVSEKTASSVTDEPPLAEEKDSNAKVT